MARAERLILPISSGAVATHYFAPHSVDAADTVLVIHGWGSRTEHMVSLIEELCGSGRAVVGLDLPGHGQSAGKRLDMALAVEAVDAAWRQYGPFTAVIGHSFGGAVAISAATGMVTHVPPRRPQRLVTISSPNAMEPVFKAFADSISLPEGSRKALYGEINRVTGHPLSAFVGSRGLAQLDMPTLVVHAHDDKEVPVDNAYGLVGAGPHIEVFWADGYGHRRILSGRDVMQVVAEFVDRAEQDSQAPAGIRFGNGRRTVTHS